jgi:hypothetical protein
MTEALMLPEVRQLSPPGALLTVAEPVAELVDDTPPLEPLSSLPPLVEPPEALR